MSLKAVTTSNGFRVQQSLGGGRIAEGKSPSGNDVQFLAFDVAVIFGIKSADGKWITSTVADPDRFGTDRSTSEAFARWIEAFGAAGEEDTDGV